MPVLKSDPDRGRWVLEYPRRPWTVNSERGRGGTKDTGHWSKRSGLVREWRQAFHDLAVEAQIPPLGQAHFEIMQICRDRRRPDTAACVLAAKAAVDGLVDAGVLPNDTADEVLSKKFWAPEVVKGTDAMRILIVRAESEPVQLEEAA